MLMLLLQLLLSRLLLLLLELREVLITHLLHVFLRILLILRLLGCAAVVQQELRKKVNGVVRLGLVGL